MTAAKEPSVEEIVAEYEARGQTMRTDDIRALISDWRKRSEARDTARAELDVLSASHKDLAHRLARIGEELEKAREERDDNKWRKSKLIGMRTERGSACALLRDIVNNAWSCDHPTLRARIAKELGPIHEDEPHSPRES